MSTLNSYMFTTDDMTGLANNVKEALVEVLNENEYLSDEQAMEIAENFTILVKQKGILGKCWDKVFFKSNDDNLRIMVVKNATNS